MGFVLKWVMMMMNALCIEMGDDDDAADAVLH